ncbi:hypothetical protein [Dictyobacter kobayashii]|uniref:Uncharacterized protein n=1 Tax=Dictyobacter kobayashii TaxID=2014872 RepID=A0A402AQE4_9CHLR|nr:hypothetical protein [Dictyobacter kobayashii]GCE21388.1 hypothetical protein KDK_51880 [Dictyobacter kobayashii]
MEKVYLYTNGLITPTNGGLLAVRWDEISHLLSPSVMVSHSGTQIALPEVTEDFQQLHTAIQQQVALTQA